MATTRKVCLAAFLLASVGQGFKVALSPTHLLRVPFRRVAVTWRRKTPPKKLPSAQIKPEGVCVRLTVCLSRPAFRTDEACCDVCPRGSSCVNGWLFNLCLKRPFQGSGTKGGGIWEVDQVLFDGGSSLPRGFLRAAGVCGKFGTLRRVQQRWCLETSGC